MHCISKTEKIVKVNLGWHFKYVISSKEKKMYSKVWNKKDSHEFVIYKQYRHQVSRLIKNAKRDYFEKTIIENKKDSKVLWQNN